MLIINILLVYNNVITINICFKAKNFTLNNYNLKSLHGYDYHDMIVTAKNIE